MKKILNMYKVQHAHSKIIQNGNMPNKTDCNTSDNIRL